MLSIGSNAVSAFISWRLNASQAADVTLVWRSQCEVVQQYGISFRSEIYGHERFRPARVVRTVEEAAQERQGYDYVFVCVKALPDVYDLAEVVRPVVTPSHTCIVLNTTTALGIEERLMEAYPRNMVLSLCSGIDINQVGPVDFDHLDSKSVHVGATRTNATLPQEAQQDMTESLVLTLEAGGVDCSQTSNIRKHQWERMMGPISMFTVSCLSQQPDVAVLARDERMGALIEGLFDEMLTIAERQGCDFSYDFKQRTISRLTAAASVDASAAVRVNTMWQDLQARRPLELEVFLAVPIRMAQELQVPCPKLEAVYALLSQLNKVNQTLPPPSQMMASPAARLAPQHTGQSIAMHNSHPPPGGRRPSMTRGMTDGAAMNGGRTMSMMYGPGPQQSRGYPARGPPPQQQQYPQPHRQQISRQNSLEGLEDFAVYNDMLNGGTPPMQQQQQQQQYRQPMPQHQQQYDRQGDRSYSGMAKKFAGMKVGGKQRARDRYNGDDDDDDDAYEAMPAAPRHPPVDPDQVDMLAMTRRGRKSSQPQSLVGVPGARPSAKQTRSSSQLLMSGMPGVHDAITSSALFGMGDNRYGTVDSRQLARNSSRANTMQGPMQQHFPNGSTLSLRQQQGPPNSMQSRNGGPVGVPSGGYPQSYRNGANGNPGGQSFRPGPPPQHYQQQQQHLPSQPQPARLAKEDGGRGHAYNGARSVTGSASASFGSLGKSSGSSSSSLERQQPQRQ